MVSARIDTHIQSGGHMAVYALGAGATLLLMKVMAGLIVGLWCMTAGTEIIALSHKFQAVWIVTVTAGDSALIHFALDK